MNKRLLNTSLLVAFFFGLDKLFALGRQYLAAQAFGLSADFDAFNVANNLPDTLVAVLAGGGLSFALIPILTETLDKHGEARDWELFSYLLNLVLTLVAALSLLIALFPLPLVQWFLAPKFASDQQRLVAELMRLNLISTVLFATSALVMSGLQAHRHFLFPALAPILYHLGQMMGLKFLAPAFGIHGLAYGVILGAAGHLAIQVPGLIRHQFRWTPRLTLADPTLQRALKLMGPRLITIAFIHAIFIINDNLASQFSAGAISALYYGWAIMQLPETVLASAAGTALLPTLSELAAQNKSVELKHLLRRALGILLALTVPIALLGMALIRPAIGWVLENRVFTAAESDLVALATQMYLVGLVGHSLKEIATRALYAHKEVVVQVFTAALNLALFVSLSQLLIPTLSFAALGLANSLAVTVEVLVMLFILYRRRIL